MAKAKLEMKEKIKELEKLYEAFGDRLCDEDKENLENRLDELLQELYDKITEDRIRRIETMLNMPNFDDKIKV